MFLFHLSNLLNNRFPSLIYSWLFKNTHTNVFYFLSYLSKSSINNKNNINNDAFNSLSFSFCCCWFNQHKLFFQQQQKKHSPPEKFYNLISTFIFYSFYSILRNTCFSTMHKSLQTSCHVVFSLYNTNKQTKILYTCKYLHY